MFATTDASYDSFFKLLDLLASRTITGNEARNTVTTILSQYTEETATILARVLTKDLKCGANQDTFEKIFPNLDIPKFGIMLASKIEEKADGSNPLTLEILSEKYGLTVPILAESKYDGNRLVCICNDDMTAVDYVSRSGKSSYYCEGLFDEEALLLAKEVGEPIIIDGEVLGSSFQDTMNAKSSTNQKSKDNLRFYAFDFMTLSEWKAKNCSKVQSERSETLKDLIKKLDLKKIIKSKFKYCYNIQELRDFYAEVLSDGFNDDGSINGLGEGLILKNPNGLYEWERSEVVRDRKTKKILKPTNWTKWKPTIDLDLTIVGWEYGKGRLAASVGSVFLKGFDENNRPIEAKCGSGLDDQTRAWLLENIEDLIDKQAVVMIEAQEVCLAQNSDIYSARFPVWIRIRDDK